MYSIIITDTTYSNTIKYLILFFEYTVYHLHKTRHIGSPSQHITIARTSCQLSLVSLAKNSGFCWRWYFHLL